MSSDHVIYGVPEIEPVVRHRDAINDRAHFPRVERGRVVRLGAICDLGRQGGDGERRSQSFSVSEFVALEDGRRVILHEARGFTIGWRHSGESGSAQVSLENLTRSVLTTVLPDDDELGEEHPWSWLADLARARGLNVTDEDLRGLPYEVIVTDDVRRWLSAG